MYFNHLFNLDDWDDTVKYIIFDDFDWKFIPSKKAFFGAQKQFTLTDKYRTKKTVHWGKPVIYLCNDLPVFDEEPDYYYTNTIIVTIYRTLII